MATVFPSSPTDRQILVKNGQRWQYESATDTWTSVNSRFDNSGTGVPLFGAFDVRENIFSEWNGGAGGTIGTYNGAGFTDTTSWATTKWNGDNIIQVAQSTGVSTGPGFRITVPAGYDTVWLRRHQGDGTQECLYEYAWNSSATAIGRTRHWGNLGMSNLIGPSGFRHQQYNDARHSWIPPMHLPDQSGGTIYIASLSPGSTTRDAWIGGFAFSRNDRHLTTASAIGMLRGDYGGYTGGTWDGDLWGQPGIYRNDFSCTDYTEVQRFGMPCINATGGDKILVLTTPRTNDGDHFQSRLWLEISDSLTGNTRVRLTTLETTGVDFNPVSEAVWLSSYVGVSTMSYRIPASALNRVTNISPNLQEVRFRLLGGETREAKTSISHAFLFDA